MFPPKEIALNLAMHSAAVRTRAKRRHNTGVLSDPERGQKALDRYAEVLPSSIEGAKILEIGPGQGVELARAAIDAGASYCAFDVADYLDGTATDALGIDYRVDPTGHLPWPDGYFDVVWSHSVLEHVPEPGALLAQVRRVIRDDGHHIASIDLETHLGGRGEPDRMYEFLKYPQWFWLAMTSHRSGYVNRLRLSQWREKFDDAGFEILDEHARHAACGLAELRAVPYLRDLSDEDLLTKAVTIVSRPRRSTRS